MSKLILHLLYGCLAAAAAIFLLAIGTSWDAKAHDYIQTIQAGAPKTVDGQRTRPFHVEIETLHLDGRVALRITNLGDDWPFYTLVGVYYAHGQGLIANQRIKLKKDQAYVLSGRQALTRETVLAFRIKPPWMDQNFETRFKHIPIDDWQQAERPTGTKAR